MEDTFLNDWLLQNQLNPSAEDFGTKLYDAYNTALNKATSSGIIDMTTIPAIDGLSAETAKDHLNEIGANLQKFVPQLQKISDPASYTNVAGKATDVFADTNLAAKSRQLGQTANDYLKELKRTQRGQRQFARNTFKTNNSTGDNLFGLNAEEKTALKTLRQDQRNDIKATPEFAARKSEIKNNWNIAKNRYAAPAINAIGTGIGLMDNALFQGKNFSNGSKAIDAGVHSASSTLAQVGGLYGAIGGAALELGNFASKAFGVTLPGGYVDNQSDSYGQNLGHMEPLATRNWLAVLTGGLSGTLNANQRSIDRSYQLRKDNMIRMAKAKSISDQQHLQSEASENAIPDTMKQNMITQAGGVSDYLSMLSAKNGAVLTRLHDFKFRAPENEEPKVIKAQNGAKLDMVEVSDEKSVIPEGALHKNKHDDFEIDVTKKGIPVITVADDNVATLEEIQAQADSVVQHAEIEHNEVIFSKELTDFIEEARKNWHASGEKDKSLCLEVGLRLTKELLQNTDDNTGLINKLDQNVG